MFRGFKGVDFEGFGFVGLGFIGLFELLVMARGLNSKPSRVSGSWHLAFFDVRFSVFGTGYPSSNSGPKKHISISILEGYPGYPYLLGFQDKGFYMGYPYPYFDPKP